MSSGVVSIVVPVFNVDPYLPNCLESLTSQTYRDLEIVLVNDGSTDMSGEICDRYARYDARVRVVHQANAGPAAARNAGAATASGECILFIDSDDWAGPDLVSHLWDVMVRWDAEVVVGNYVENAHEPDLPRPAPVQAATVLTSDEAMRALLGPRHTLWTVATGKLFRRSLLTGLEFPEGRLHEDEFFTYLGLARAESVAYTSAAHYFYRQRSGSIMDSQLDLRRGTDAIDAYRQRANYIRQHGPADLVGEAHAQLFRRYLRLYRALEDPLDAAARRDLRHGMRQLVRDFDGMAIGRGFRTFSIAYAWAPWVVEPVYGLHLRRRPSTRGDRDRSTYDPARLTSSTDRQR